MSLKFIYLYINNLDDEKHTLERSILQTTLSSKVYSLKHSTTLSESFLLLEESLVVLSYPEP